MKRAHDAGPATRLTPLAIGALLAGGCVADGHPLGSNGIVEIVVAVEGPLFATDQLDEAGSPAGPRQSPYRSDVLLRITEDTEVGHGAFVYVHVQPAEALKLGPALEADAEGATHEDGSGPTCEIVDGAFRCRGNAEGFARFSITSPADWHGDADLVVTWAAAREVETITVLPAGLPSRASNFQLVGLADGEVVRPQLTAVACSIDALEQDLGTKWPAGRIRARPVFVRATPPLGAPGVLENAPVVVESLSNEGALSLDETCLERTTRLRVLLNKNGESPQFFACFSDIGGDVGFAAQSGEKVLDPGPTIRVGPEPRLLRVVTIDADQTVEATLVPEQLFEVSAFDVDLTPIAMDVDLALDGDIGVLQLLQASATLSPEGAPAAVISAIPMSAGAASLIVRPRLLAEPSCESSVITVVDPF